MNKHISWSGERIETFVFNESAIEHLHRYGIAKDFVKDKIVLDIACGEGYGSYILSSEAKAVTGIDSSGTVIKNAAEKYKKPNLAFKEGYVENIPAADRSFDIVVSFETIEHITDHGKMLQEIKRVLKEDGLVILSTPEKKFYSDESGYNNPFHKKELYEDELRNLIKMFFGHSYFLYQRLMVASVILLDQETNLKFYEGDYTKITSRKNFDPIYLVAIASDVEIKKPFSSLFSGNSILQTALKQKEKDIHSTFSYRIGHFLLFPFKWMRRMIRK